MTLGELVEKLGGKLVHGSTEIEVAGVDVPELAGGSGGFNNFAARANHKRG